jgi:hypothetical protein
LTNTRWIEIFFQRRSAGVMHGLAVWQIGGKKQDVELMCRSEVGGRENKKKLFAMRFLIPFLLPVGLTVK